jgi:DNA/RNA endonuclease G (NUC1)
MVQDRVVSKLSNNPPTSLLIQEYLKVFRERVFVTGSETIGIIEKKTIARVQENRGGAVSTTTTACVPSAHKTTTSVVDWSNDECGRLSTVLSEMSLSPQTFVENERMLRNVGRRPLSMLSPTLPLRVFCPNPSLEIAFDVRTRNPVYVMEQLTGEKDTSKVVRPQFYEEKALPEEYRSRRQHYLHSGYDRGHMAPAADFGGENVKDTFNMCNISPQVHSMNVSIWAKLEHWCRRIARHEKEENGGVTYVVTGPLWLPAKQVSEKHFEYNFPAIGCSSSLVQVPTHYFKVVVVILDNALRKFACFVVPNAEVDKSKKLLENYVVQWADLEAMSGLQFFASLTSKEGWKETVQAITERVISKRSILSRNFYDLTKNNKIGSSTKSLKHLPLS